MTMLPMTVVLAAILCAGAIVLRLGGRERRVERQLAVALGEGPIEAKPAASILIRTNRGARFANMLRVVMRYTPGAPYNWPIQYVLLISAAIGGGAVLIGNLMFPLWLAMLDGPVSACLFIRALYGWKQRRYADRILRQLPDTIELTVSAVRAGLPVLEAFHAVNREMPDPTREQFAMVIDEIAMGRTIEEALRGVFHRSHVPEYAMFSVTLAVQMKSGGRLAETLQILGDAIRERVALAGRAKALTGEARLAAWVMASLPFLAGTALYFEVPSSITGLFDDDRGRMLLALAITFG